MNWLTVEQKQQIKQLAADNPHEESCGFVLENGDVIAVKNIHTEKEFNFKIDGNDYLKWDKEGIKGIWHSHTIDSDFSPTDQMVMRCDTLPWAVYCISKNTFTEADLSKPAPLLGRPFIYGVWDCYSLTTDFVKEAGVILPPWKRGPYGEWEQPGFFEFDNNWDKYNTIDVTKKKYQKYDIVLMNLGSIKGHTDHIGVFMDEGRTLLHHPYNGLSRKNRWSQWLATRTNLVVRPRKLCSSNQLSSSALQVELS